MTPRTSIAVALMVVARSSRNSSGGSKTSATSKSSSFKFRGGDTRADYRCHDKTRTGAILRQATQNLDLGRRKADFFPCFTQRGGLG
jgi:hypothetical protein